MSLVTRQNKQDKQALPVDPVSELDVNQCHDNLHQLRSRILSFSEDFRRVSAAYYLVCDLQGPSDSQNGDESLQAIREFIARGMLVVKEDSVAELSGEYVSHLKRLKALVDLACRICDRLADLNTPPSGEEQVVEAPPTPVVAATQELDASLLAEFGHEEGMKGFVQG